MSVAPPETTSPRARRIAAPRWLDLRLVLGIALVLGSVLIGARIVASAGDTSPTVAARRDLAAGTIITAGDLKIAQARLPGDGRRAYLTQLHDAVGKQLARAVSAGELLPADAVGTVASRTTVTVPLGTGAAPDLHTGQRVEVWVSTPTCSSQVLLSDVAVQAVHSDSSGAFTSDTEGQDVVISVVPALADRVMQALAFDQVRLRAGVLVGTRDDQRSAAALPDLSACASAPAPR